MRQFHIRRLRLIYLCVLASGSLLTEGYAQIQPDTGQVYKPTELFIPMRDGVRLHTVILTPRESSVALPILMERTPYGVDWWLSPSNVMGSSLKTLAENRFIFAFQDIRGRYKSEGTFVMLRPGRDKRDPKSIDESSDAYDTIDWLVKNAQGNNGRVGVMGVSYDAWLTVMAALEPHPALKAVSEQATVADMYLGDDFHHNGAFRLAYGFEYAFEEEFSKVDTLYPFDKYDTYDWYLTLGPLSNVNRNVFHGKLPTWNNFVSHPDYDAFWKAQALASRLNKVNVPTLHVAGWWDQEDFYGPMKAYELLEKKDSTHSHFLVVGPWNHGGWRHGPGSELGSINFGDSTGKYFREKVELPWFRFFLKDSGSVELPKALAFQTGSNVWKSYDRWPPIFGTKKRNIYLQGEGRLGFSPPVQDGASQFDAYVSDPAHPVPYRPRPIEATYGRGSRWNSWLVADQRFVHMRPDVLSWQTDTLKESVVVTGDVVAHLFASTSGTDCDWIVKLIDVYPESYPPKPEMGGYQLMIADEVLRGRYRRSFERPEAMIPDKVEEYVIDLHTNNHAFLRGHRIMVQVQSSWFPIIDRNPQKFVMNIFEAKPGDYIPATQQVYRSRHFPSYVELPVAEE